MIYKSADFLNLQLRNLVQVDPTLGELTVVQEDLNGLDFQAENLIATIVSRVVARSTPQRPRQIGTLDIYTHGDTEV